MIYKTMFSKLVLLLIFSVLLSHFSYSQKQVQQFFFPQDGYVLGVKNHLLDVGYTDGTQGFLLKTYMGRLFMGRLSTLDV